LVFDRMYALSDGHRRACYRLPGIWNNDRDVRTLKRTAVGVARSPRSNTKAASGVAPVIQMLIMGVKLGLGTDGFVVTKDTRLIFSQT